MSWNQNKSSSSEISDQMQQMVSWRFEDLNCNYKNKISKLIVTTKLLPADVNFDTVFYFCHKNIMDYLHNRKCYFYIVNRIGNHRYKYEIYEAVNPNNATVKPGQIEKHITNSKFPELRAQLDEFNRIKTGVITVPNSEGDPFVDALIFAANTHLMDITGEWRNA